MVAIPPSNGSGLFTDIINDIVVIFFASLASYVISREVAKLSVKSVLKSFSVNDVITIAKRLIINASNDEELKKNVNLFMSNMVKTILSNPDLRLAAKDVIKGLLEDPEIGNSMKKVISSAVEQYPVLAKLLGVNNAKRKDT